MTTRVAIGIDPGFASFGVAVLEIQKEVEIPLYLHVIRTQKSSKKLRMLSVDDNFERTQRIADELTKLVLSYDVVAIGAEAMSFPRNASSSAKVGMAWGVIASVALRQGLPVFQCSPQQLKQKIAGSKKASKPDVANALRQRYPDTDFDDLLKALPMGEHEHAWDALGSVVVCLDAEPVKMVRRML